MEKSKPSASKEFQNDFIRIDFQKLFYRMLSFWWLFIICIGLAIAAANFYLRYTTYEYSATAILLIKDAGDSGKISTQDILSINDGLAGGKSLENEIQILKSLSLQEKVVEKLNLNTQYFRKGKLKETELYTNSCFLLDSLELSKDLEYGANFAIELSDYNSFLLRKNENEDWKQYYFGVPFENAMGRFVINLNPKKAILEGEYRLQVSPTQAVANQYRSRIAISLIGDPRTSSVLSISLIDPVPEKARDFINTLIDIYNFEEIKDENQILVNTLDFIDLRVSDLINELDSVEGGIQKFKSSNEIISNNAVSSLDYTLDEVRLSLKEISQYEVQKNVLRSIESFLVQDNYSFSLIPSNLFAENPSIAGLVNQHNDLVSRNKQMSSVASEKNPIKIALIEQIGDTKNLILQSIKNQRKDIQIPIDQLENNIIDLRKSMSSIPSIEKRLIEKMRTQEVKEKLFLFLLQKREETALTEAVTTAKTRTIDRARLPRFAIYPQRKLVMILSGFLGFLLPLLLILLFGLFENKIDSEETIKSLTQIPILGRIAQSKTKETIVVKHGSRSTINEMFRLLRTNLNFISHKKTSKTIMLTSSISGEGKTFIVLNLGITLSLSDKKVILIGLDLRKPKLASYMGGGHEKGVTNYLIGQNSLDEIIQPMKEHDNLSFISSGPIPPNPAELILSDKMQELLKELSSRYDYVLIDTPPIGLVSDALLLRDNVDNILMVVRQNYTKKAMVKHLENMYSNNELDKASIIINGVKQGKNYYGYGGYYYGKNQGYYVED